MIQKRILAMVALPVAAAVARMAAGKLRKSGRTTAADRIEQVINMVSPQKKSSRFGR